MRVSLALLLVPLVVAEPVVKPTPVTKPIISTELFYGTAELVYDIYDVVLVRSTNYALGLAGLNNGAQEKLKETVTKKVTDALDAGFAKAGVDKQVVVSKFNEAMAGCVYVKATMNDQLAKALKYLDGVSATLVAKFDASMPQCKGMVPSTFLDLLVFKIYMCTVLYFLWRIVFWCLGMVKSIFCCICCCGCCRRKGTAAASPKKGKGADSKGKVAVAAPAAAKQKAKK